MGRKRDKILKILERKTKSWTNKYFQGTTHTRLTPMPKETHCLAALFTTTQDKYSSRNGFPLQIEIIPPVTYNTIVIESRIGDEEGTGFAVKTSKAEEGHPNDIPEESLEQNLENLYKQVRQESFDSFMECFRQSNVHHTKKHLENLVITTPTGARKRVSQSANLDLFYHLEPTKQVRFQQDNNNLRLPSQKIQQLLRQVSNELIGENEVEVNGFQTLAEISVINESERIATSEGSAIRSGFSGYWIVYKIFFYSPLSGETFIEWDTGVDHPSPRKDFLIKKARDLNQAYNEFFNNKEAITIPTGRWEVYLEPDNTSTQIHEAIVHACSSDAIVDHIKYPGNDEDTDKAFTIEDINTLIANPNLQIICNSKKKHKDGKLCWGSFRYDHETVEPQRFYIVKNGVLTGLLADRNDAYILNQIYGKKFIKPGSSRFGRNDGSEIGIESQNPRTSTIEVRWLEDLTKEELEERFFERIKKHGRVIPYKNKRRKAGLWLKGGCHGEYTAEGQSKVYFNLAYLVFDNGESVPIRDMLFTSNSPRTILGNIQGIASKREHSTGRCGLGEGGEYRIRESLFCGSSIISDFEVKKVSQLLRRYDE